MRQLEQTQRRVLTSMSGAPEQLTSFSRENGVKMQDNFPVWFSGLVQQFNYDSKNV